MKQVIIEMFANNSAQDNFEAKRTLEEVLLLSCALLSSSKYLSVREGFKKSKWKFKMAFVMKGGRDRSRVPHTYFEK